MKDNILVMGSDIIKVMLSTEGNCLKIYKWLAQVNRLGAINWVILLHVYQRYTHCILATPPISHKQIQTGRKVNNHPDTQFGKWSRQHIFLSKISWPDTP